MPHRPNAANGYLVKAGAGAVWFAGDTSLYDDMTGLPAIVGGRIDLAIVPIGGWGARLSKGHMGPREAAQACAMVGAGAVLPVHWGTLYAPWLPDIPRGWMDRPGPAFAAALRDEAPECRLVALEPGGSAHLTLDSPGVGESDPD
jgi:L-ascorbate metabolism protein UlaG (beta-lactamase superfamily)